MLVHDNVREHVLPPVAMFGLEGWLGLAMNIYIGNLNAAVTETEIRGLFQAYGAVGTATVVKDRDTGRSRGFGFVEMPNDEEAQAAIKALNGTIFAEQSLSINEARSKYEDLTGRTPDDNRKDPRETLPTRKHRQHRY